MRKRVFVLFVAMVLCVAMMAGCGVPSTPSESASAESSEVASEPAQATEVTETSEEPVTLRILAGQSTSDAGIEEFITEAVAKKYPHITLEWECVDWGTGFQPKMQVYMQSGLPDIMVGKAQDVVTYGTLGLLADLSGKSYMSEVLDAANNGVTLDGKLYGLTYNALYQGVYYNKAMFKDNGWTVPDTLEQLQAIIDDCKAKGITPFATHMVDTWSIGNMTMQFAVNDVFRNTPDWGDQLRAGTVSYTTSEEYRKCYEYNKLIYDNTWSAETFSTEQTACDAKMVQGEAAMKVSGSWSIQNFLDVDESFEFGIFPFPNQTGDAKLLFEPNMTYMASAASTNQDAIDKVLEVISTDKELALQIYNYTKTAPMIKGVTPTFTNPSQADIDMYAAEGRIQDVNLGNNQLQWGGFQEENAKDIAEYLQGNITIDDALAAADARKDNSKAVK